jgi:alpha-D-ribose 1-methylphosphonate 5-triphosphate synthase subunit PhnH
MTRVATNFPAGFADPVFDSQATFRAVLDALARPGTVCEVPVALAAPVPLTPAAAAVCLTLLDFETPLWVQSRNAQYEAWLAFHCGCPIVSAPRAARFAVVDDIATMPPLAVFDAGSPEFPDRSATVIVQVPSLREGAGWLLTGPGVRGRARLEVGGAGAEFLGAWRANTQLFPCGVDIVFAAGTRLAALSRTTRVEV